MFTFTTFWEENPKTLNLPSAGRIEVSVHSQEQCNFPRDVKKPRSDTPPLTSTETLTLL